MQLAASEASAPMAWQAGRPKRTKAPEGAFVEVRLVASAYFPATTLTISRHLVE